MMEAKLLNTPADFKRLDLDPNHVAEWEDGMRETVTPNHFEWWYFDMILDDGTKVVVQFLTKLGNHFKDDGAFPGIKFTVTLPDGTRFHQEPKIKQFTAAKDTCNVQMDAHYVKGNLREYHIHIEENKGLGCDFVLKSQASPYRPGTAYMQFGDPANYYTWFCVVPRGELTGTLTVKGQTRTVHGRGYHDHQWGSMNFHTVFNNWVWARQSYDDFSLLVFDMVSKEEYGKKRFPIVFLQDNDGNLIFESTDNVTCRVENSYHDSEGSGKDYPSEVDYLFEKDGKTLHYHLKMNEIIENMGVKNMPLAKRLFVKMMKMNLSYARYTGTGTMDYFDGEKHIERTAPLIYEFMYPGTSFKGYM